MSESPVSISLATRYATVQQAVARALDRRRAIRGEAGEPAPQLIAVSKQQPYHAIETAQALGIRAFGENRVQEAQAKWPPPDQRPAGLSLHLIGALQRNKAQAAVAFFDVIHSLDRIPLAEALAEAQARSGRTPLLLIQVNIGQEPQKAGVSPQDLPALLARGRALGLAIEGLMCVPPATLPPAPYFALLARLAADHGLRELSMGMSEDYETAILLGATMVRIGTALFGPRDA